MDDEVEVMELVLQPMRYTKLDLLGLGLHFVSDALETGASWFQTLALMTKQQSMQNTVDRKFGEIVGQ